MTESRAALHHAHDPNLRPEAVSAELERLILDTADEGFCLFSAGPSRTSRVLTFNQRFADIFNFDLDWLYERPNAVAVAYAIFECQRGEISDDAQEYLARVLRRHESPGERDIELSLNDGRYVVGRTRAASSGERLYTFRDISNERRILNELNAERGRFRELIEGISDLIFYEHDADRRLTYVSPSVKSLLGYEPAQLLGHRFGEFDHITGDDGLEMARMSIARAIRSRSRQPQYEVQLRHRSGRALTFDIIEYPIIENNRVLGIRGVARNVSAIIQMRRQLRERERLAILGTFAGGLAHDLNNLLLPIRASLDVLERDPDQSRVGERVGRIRRATDHIAELTSKLLVWTRHDTTTGPSAKSTPVTDVYTWAPQAIVFYQDAVRTEDLPANSATGKVITASLELADPPRKAQIDPDLLKQAVLNLFLNARDAMSESGTVTLRIAPSPDDWDEPIASSRPSDSETDIPGRLSRADTDAMALHVSPSAGESAPSIPADALKPRMRAVRFSVIDHGCGMEQKVIDRAFDPFFSTKPRGRSTGLGLALVASIVRTVDGLVSIDSHLGKGTTISLDIPVPAGQSPEEEGRAIDHAGFQTCDSVTGRPLILDADDSAGAPSAATPAGIHSIGHPEVSPVVHDDARANLASDPSSPRTPMAKQRRSVLISLSDARSAAYIRTAIKQIGHRARSDALASPEDSDAVWIIDPGMVDPAQVQTILHRLPGLRVVALGRKDSRPAWPEAILWVDGSVSADTIRSFIPP